MVFGMCHSSNQVCDCWIITFSFFPCTWFKHLEQFFEKLISIQNLLFWSVVRTVLLSTRISDYSWEAISNWTYSILKVISKALRKKFPSDVSGHHQQFDKIFSLFKFLNCHMPSFGLNGVIFILIFLIDYRNKLDY